MDEIRRLRRERGLSQARLAALARLDPSTINMVERGRHAPTLQTLEKIAEALDVGVGDLLPKAETPARQLSLNNAIAETGEPEVDYRQRYINLIRRVLADVDEALGTEDYEEFATRYSPEEQHWRIDLASRLNALAEEMLDDMREIENGPKTELQNRRERLAAVVERFKAA